MVDLITLENVRGDPGDTVDHHEFDLTVVNQLHELGGWYPEPPSGLTEPQNLDRPLTGHPGHLQASQV